MAKDYQNYGLFDFITDEYFKSWIINPSPESDYFWKSWLESHPEKADVIATAREFVLSMKFKKQIPSTRKSEIYQQVVEASKQSTESSTQGFMIIPVILKVAAAIFLVIGLGGVVKYYSIESVSPEKTLTAVYETKVTRKGEKLTVMLPDGTLVKLNAESSIKFPEAFVDKREVYLTGEAFFEVVRDTTKPFTVATRHLRTTALGTSFNINAYSEEEEVILLTGKVRINNSDSHQSEILLPGEKVAFLDGTMKKSINVSLDQVRWKDGVLIFQETPFAKGIECIERWYGVTFDIRNLKDREVFLTGYFDNQNLKNVLESLSYTARFEYQVEGKKVLITF